MKSNNSRTTRRNFLRLSAAAATGISVNAIGGNRPFNAIDSEAHKLSDGSKRLMELFNLKYPIFQAAPGGAKVASAMSQAGCIGAMQLTWISADECRSIVRGFVDTKTNFYGNFVLHFPPNNLDVALDLGLKIVQFSWGIPDEALVKKIRSHNARFGVQVASKEGATLALRLNPDFLICQGIEAGGHVQAYDPVKTTLSQVIEIAGQVPVIAAGGIATGHDIRKMLDAGASGVALGTRLVATRESDSHEVYKQSLVDAKDDATVFTNCFNSGWNAMHRVLKNNTYLTWLAAGCPLVGKRPGEGEVVGKHPSGSSILRYSSSDPTEGTTGQIKEMIMYAGMGVKDINDVPSVRDLIPRLWKECQDSSSGK